MDTVTYVASSGNIPNPERGFYRWIDCNSVVTAGQLATFAAEDGTLLQCNFDLDAFISSPISGSRLNELQSFLDTVRDGGMKVVLRFRYDGVGSSADADITRIEQHIDQLQPYLQSNQDVIAVVQAGFIGAWGEWGNSDNFGVLPTFSAQNWIDRQAMIDKLLAALPADRMVQLRTPGYKQTLFGATALTATEAYSGSSRARVGHHNDCFLAPFNDYGTYDDPSTQYPYLAADSNYVPVGGETCAYTPAPSRSHCETALEEMALFHWSYLNDNYHPDVLTAFQTEGCYDEIKQRLGYRFVLQDAELPRTARAGGQMAVTLRVKNDGFATPYNPREVNLVLRNVMTGVETTLALNTDPRLWMSGQTTVIEETLTLPGTLAAGEYTMLLSLPDPQPSLHGRAEYAIRFANDGVWEAATGFNQLLHTVDINP